MRTPRQNVVLSVSLFTQIREFYKNYEEDIKKIEQLLFELTQDINGVYLEADQDDIYKRFHRLKKYLDLLHSIFDLNSTEADQDDIYKRFHRLKKYLDLLHSVFDLNLTKEEKDADLDQE